jgi:hypothetical protein
MRSQALLLRRARTALADIPHKAPSSRALISRRTPRVSQRPDRVFARPSSSAGAPSGAVSDELPAGSGSAPVPEGVPPPEASEAAASEATPPGIGADSEVKKVRRTRTPKESPSAEPPLPPPSLPNGLNVLWSPDADGSVADASALPPPEILEEALTNMRVAFHPQTQHKATYATADGPPNEPTLALYCPVEGGDYIVDETVRELARRTGSEVVVLDAVQLAAGEWGQFGKGRLRLTTWNSFRT